MQFIASMHITSYYIHLPLKRFQVIRVGMVFAYY